MSTAISTVRTGSPTKVILLQLITFVLATSSIVFIEPAPYDALVIGLFCVSVALGLRFPREIQIAALLLTVFLLSNLLASLLSRDPTTTIRFLSVRIYLVLTWALFTSLLVADVERVSAAIWKGYLVAALIAMVWGSMEFFGLIPSENWEGGLRAKGPFKDPNVYAPFLIPAAIYSLKEFYIRRSSALKYIYGALFIVYAFGILIGFSRGAWLAFVISYGLFSLMLLVSVASSRERLGLLLANITVLLLSVAALSIAVMTTTVADRFFQRAVISQKYDLKEGGRFYTQQRSLEVIGQTPIGIGPGRSNLELGLQPHNLYLHMFLESGWIGGFTFFVFLFYTLYRALALMRWRSPARADLFVVLASLTGLLLQSLFIDSTHWRHFWLLLAMIWGLIVVYERSADRSPR